MALMQDGKAQETESFKKEMGNDMCDNTFESGIFRKSLIVL